jgi:hypothetical protein
MATQAEYHGFLCAVIEGKSNNYQLFTEATLHSIPLRIIDLELSRFAAVVIFEVCWRVDRWVTSISWRDSDTPSIGARWHH